MRILMLNYEYPPLGGGAANANCCMPKEFAKAMDLQVDLATSSAISLRLRSSLPMCASISAGAGKNDVHFRGQGEILRRLIAA